MKKDDHIPHDPARVTAVVDNRDGTYTVLRCNNKEQPEGRRRIVRRFTFPTMGKALTLANAITGTKT